MDENKFNSAGYYDPTAYEAIRTADNDARKLKINYPQGYMEINMNYFFPCTLEKARKISTLMQKYSSEVDIKKVLNYLEYLKNKYNNKMEAYEDLLSHYSKDEIEYHEYNAKFKEAKLFHQRAEKNIEIFKTGR